MKTKLLLLLVLIIHFSYAQDKQSEFHQKIFGSKKESNKYLTNAYLLNRLEEIKSLKLDAESNNSEGKFPVYNLNMKEDIDVYNLIRNSNETYTAKQTISKLKETSILMINYIDFINQLIIKNQEKTNLLFVNKVYPISNSELDLYNNLTKFFKIINYDITSKIEIQVGNDMYKYLNKINKTVLDKTLQNSLNLVAVNF